MLAAVAVRFGTVGAVVVALFVAFVAADAIIEDMFVVAANLVDLRVRRLEAE